MAKTIIIGCKLPHGLILEHPTNPAHKVTLNGANKASIIGAGYATTEVDEEFWAAWKTAAGADFAPLQSGAIFEAKNQNDMFAVAREKANEKTGFEPLPQNGDGVSKAEF